jgi:hypothetical protein
MLYIIATLLVLVVVRVESWNSEAVKNGSKKQLEYTNVFTWIHGTFGVLGYVLGYTPTLLKRAKAELRNQKKEFQLDIAQADMQSDIRMGSSKEEGKAKAQEHHNERIEKLDVEYTALEKTLQEFQKASSK